MFSLKLLHLTSKLLYPLMQLLQLSIIHALAQLFVARIRLPLALNNLLNASPHANHIYLIRDIRHLLQNICIQFKRRILLLNRLEINRILQ